jgi:parvulin-like peptidyl-prolyl isomerase
LIREIRDFKSRIKESSGGFDNFARFETSSANFYALDAAAQDRANGLKVRVKAAIGAVVGVAHAVTELWPLATYLATFRHESCTSDEYFVMKAKQQFNTGGGAAVKPFFRRSGIVVRISRITLLAAMVGASLLVASCKSSSSDPGSEVVARVGSRDITIKQIDSEIKQQVDAGGGRASFSSSELIAARMSVLDNLIQAEALFQKAQKENLAPDDNKVTQEVQKKKQEAGVTEEQYQNQIKQAGLTEEDVREKVRRELAINALREREKARVTAPTDAEIEKYYNENKAQFVAERGADIAIIVTDPANNGAADDSIGDAAAEQKIKAIYEQLKGGADFATIASQRSEDPTSAMRAGNLGFGSEAALKQSFPTRPELPQQLMSLSPGQVTEPIKDNLSGKWYIFKVNNKIEQPRNLTLNDVRKTIIDTLTQQRQQILLNALMMVALLEANVKNHMAERIVQNPKIITELQPSPLLGQGSEQPQQQPQPRIENENRSSSNANRP